MTTSAHPTRAVLEPLAAEDCWARLRTAAVARVAHVTDGQPHISVVNVTVEGDDVLVRSTRGSRVSAALARPGARVALQVEAIDEDAHGGWSVVAHGTMTPVLDTVETARLDRIHPPSWLLGDHGGTWLRLHVATIAGRHLHPSPGST